jgi:hypothetical protein
VILVVFLEIDISIFQFISESGIIPWISISNVLFRNSDRNRIRVTGDDDGRRCGYVINGRIHAHMTLATPDKVIAGHMEAGNEVYTYAIVTIGVMNGTNLDKIDDKTYR